MLQDCCDAERAIAVTKEIPLLTRRGGRRETRGRGGQTPPMLRSTTCFKLYDLPALVAFGRPLLRQEAFAPTPTQRHSRYAKQIHDRNFEALRGLVLLESSL